MCKVYMCGIWCVSVNVVLCVYMVCGVCVWWGCMGVHVVYLCVVCVTYEGVWVCVCDEGSVWYESARVCAMWCGVVCGE